MDFNNKEQFIQAMKDSAEKIENLENDVKVLKAQNKGLKARIDAAAVKPKEEKGWLDRLFDGEE